MSYLIDGKRITQLKRAGLLKMLERVHGDLQHAERLVQSERVRGGEMREECDMAIAQRDQAVAELDATVIDRDHYKKEYVNNSLKLMTAETHISERDGTIAALRRDATDLMDALVLWRWAAIICAVGCVLLGVAGLLWLA